MPLPPSGEMSSLLGKKSPLRDSFLFANVLQFLHFFSETLGMEPLVPWKLEEIIESSMEGQVESETRIGRIYKRLVKALHKSKAPTDESLSQTLSREYRRHLADAPALLEATLDGQRKIWPPLTVLGSMDHLQILHDLCSFVLFDLDTLFGRPEVLDQGALWRLSPYGPDRQGTRYWLLADCWLYAERPASDEWSCVAWSTESWQNFLQNNSFVNSRRGVDKECLKELREDAYTSKAEPILSREERKLKVQLKKEQAELQRLAYLDSRKRSSRLAAKEKIRQDIMVMESTITTPLAKSTPTNVASLSRKPEKRLLSREERMALREQKITRREEQAILQALTTTHGYQGEGGGQDSFESSQDLLDVLNSEEEDYEEAGELDQSHDGGEERSPIKLVVKLGPQGVLKAQVFIGDQEVKKDKLLEAPEEPDSTRPVSRHTNSQPQSVPDVMPAARLATAHEQGTGLEIPLMGFQNGHYPQARHCDNPQPTPQDKIVQEDSNFNLKIDPHPNLNLHPGHVPKTDVMPVEQASSMDFAGLEPSPVDEPLDSGASKEAQKGGASHSPSDGGNIEPVSFDIASLLTNFANSVH